MRRCATRVAHQNWRRPLEGNAISRTRIYLDASRLGIENIFDAAYFAYNAYAISATLRLPTLWQALTTSVRYRLLSLQRGKPFPDESQWLTAGHRHPTR